MLRMENKIEVNQIYAGTGWEVLCFERLNLKNTLSFKKNNVVSVLPVVPRAVAIAGE